MHHQQGVTPGSTLAVAYAAGLTLAATTAWLPVAQQTAAYALLVLACSVRARPLAAAFAGAIAWSMLTGFGVNALGTLTFGSADVVRLLGLLAAALLGCAATRSRPDALV